ncbi:MAG: helix-hairpin-helix domain-containing protein [Bacteroidales bacterium]|nr:helix-hairpin-helix domain-containing protein [Bacteroidales bacterium]
MNQKIVWLFLIGLMFNTFGLAQIDSIAGIEELLVDFLESSDLEPDEDEIFQYLSSHQKINLNRLDPGDLSKIPFLTPLQTRNLTEYLNKYGEVFSMYELQAIEGFDSALIQRLLPFLEIGQPPVRIRMTPGNLIRQGRHEVVFRYQQVMQRQAGYRIDDSIRATEPESYYLGSPQRYYFRYRYSFADRLVIGFSGDKDAGEEFFRGSQPWGMDFCSGFISVQNLRWLKQLTVGNFRASFGQGLSLGGSSFGSSVSFGSAMRYNAGFTPSQSACEYGYLRGAALTIQTGRMEWSGFFSAVRKDATILQGDSGEAALPAFSSFFETGYHRTLPELAKKNQVRERISGGHVSYRGRFFIIGLTCFYGTWSGVLQSKEEVYRNFSLQGNRFGVLGIDGRCRIAFAQLFGELSVSLNGGKAWVAGISVVPLSGLDLLLICRSYQPDFQNPFSTAISQNSVTANEQGLFIRLQAQLIPKTTISGYIDLFRFPWLRYQVNGPSGGMEAGLLGHYQVSPFWSLSLRYSLKRAEINSCLSGGNTTPLTEERRSNLKVECHITASPTVSLRSCLALRNYRTKDQTRETGYLASQEFIYKRAGVFRGVQMKYILFDIPYYNARIYTYEPDVLYSWSSPACYGRGIRCVLMVQAETARRVEFWGWVGITKYLDRTNIGSGLELINGSLKSEVKVQLRIKL